VRYLGIDGGGSKTTFLLVDEYYNEVCHVQSGPSNWLSVGAGAAREAITEGISHLTERPDIVCRLPRTSPRPLKEFSENPLCDVLEPVNGVAILAVPRFKRLCSDPLSVNVNARPSAVAVFGFSEVLARPLPIRKLTALDTAPCSTT